MSRSADLQLYVGIWNREHVTLGPRVPGLRRRASRASVRTWPSSSSTTSASCRAGPSSTTPPCSVSPYARSGWTKTVRPPTSVTNKLKTQIDAAYSLPASTTGELDHLISLELGGAPSDPANLWVEPGKIPNAKDAVENKLHSAVCSGLIPLAIARNWTTSFDDAGLRDTPSKCATSHRGDEDGN